jgi:DNA phosphorothioation-associated putative methyltransferase
MTASNGYYFPRSGYTAIKRASPSLPARFVFKEIIQNDEYDIKSILDWGCGFGRDIKYFQEHVDHVEGWDPCLRFIDYTHAPTTNADLVTCSYVINVIAHPSARERVIKLIADYTNKGGLILISARSKSDVERHAKKRGWPKFGDGYISSKAKRTFQKGFMESELVKLIVCLDWQNYQLVKLGSHVVSILVRVR